MTTQTRRRVRRLEHAPKRSREEVLTAVGACVGVVAFTIFGVWMLRPGGLAGRQPRATWLVVAVLVAVIVLVALAMRPETTPRRRKVWFPSALAAVMIIGLTVWLVWPGGILRTYPSSPEIDFDELISQSSVSDAATPLDETPLEDNVGSEAPASEPLPPDTATEESAEGPAGTSSG